MLLRNTGNQLPAPPTTRLQHGCGKALLSTITALDAGTTGMQELCCAGERGPLLKPLRPSLPRIGQATLKRHTQC